MRTTILVVFNDAKFVGKLTNHKLVYKFKDLITSKFYYISMADTSQFRVKIHNINGHKDLVSITKCDEQIKMYKSYIDIWNKLTYASKEAIVEMHEKYPEHFI